LEDGSPRRRGTPLLCAVLMAGLCVGVGGESSIPVLDVYRMVQYDQGDAMLGSRRSGVSMLASPSAKGEVSRKAVVLDFNSVTEELLDELIGTKPAGALIIVLPENLGELSDQQRATWMKAESNLMKRKAPMSVYFTVDGEEARAMKAKVEQNMGDVKLVVPPDANTARIKKIEAENFQGVLAGGGSEPGDSAAADTAPTIAVVAYYDTFGVAPGLAMGADSNGSGVIALLELARLFGKLYTAGKNRGNYNLIFVLTAGGKMNFAGARSWLSNTDVRLLDTIEFALCLESVGLGSELFLHTSKPLKDPTLSKLFGTLSSVGAGMDVKVSHVHKKVNISDTTVNWEHEQFSRKRILAGTLSRHPQVDTAARNTIIDTKVDPEVLKRNILLIANALARHIYGTPASLEIFSATNSVQDHFLAAWSNGVSNEPRVVGMPTVAQSPTAATPLVARAYRVLKDTCTETSSHKFIIDGDKSFYRGAINAKMSVYAVRPISFDMIYCVCVLTYLLGLLIFMQGTVEARNTIVELFKGRKRKRA